MSSFLKLKNLSLKRKVGIILLFGIVTAITFFYLFIRDSDYYKSALLDAIKGSIPYQVEFSRTDLLLFPYPGIRFEYITLKDKNSIEVGYFGRLDFRISWNSVITRKLKLRSVDVQDGRLDISSNNIIPIGSNNDEQKKSNFILNLKKISLSNFTLIFRHNGGKRIHRLYTHEADLFVSMFNSSGELRYLGKLNDQYMKVVGDFSYRDSFLNYRDLRLNLKAELQEFSLEAVKYLLSDFVNADFTEALITGNIDILKNTNDKTEFTINTKLSRFGFKGGRPFIDLFLNTNFYYSKEEKRVKISPSLLEWPGKIKLSIEGDVNWHDTFHHNLQIVSGYSDFNSVILLVQLLATKNSKDPYYTGSFMNLDIRLNNFYAFGHYFNSGIMFLHYRNDILEIRSSTMNLYSGKMYLNGKVYLYATNYYDCHVKMENVDVEKMIHVYTKDKLFNGRMFAGLHFKSHGNGDDAFMKNLVGDGYIMITNGKLLGYANALKPVASLGKFMNVLGPRGESTEFSSLESPLRVKNKKVYFDRLTMKGVGLDARGNGFIGLNNEIDMRIKVGFGGAVGKLLYVPVVYKGIMPDNFAYVDPVWLGSVYFGMTFLAGPAGATVGGIAGSAVSDFVHSAWEGFKGIFRSKENEKSDAE